MKVDNYTQYVCPTVPLQCEENATFLVDTDKLRKFSDLTVDDNGKRPSGSKLYVTKTERGYKSSRQITQSYDFQLRKSYYVHAGTPDFHKIVYTIRNSEGHNLRHAIIQYYFQDGKVVPVLKNVPHGNSKKENPFIRTKPSAIAEMKNKSVYMQPKKVVADLFNEEGVSLNFKSPSDIPRDRPQIYNINRSNPRKYQTGGKCITNFDAIIKMSVEGNFARSFEMKENGHARCFLATDQQLLDVKKFCCNSDSILGIDPTFDLGGFYLTCTTYRHPMFVIRDSGRHPLLLGPCMMHLKRETSDYEYFGKTLSGYIKDDVVNVWGSDGEKALINGLQKSNAFQGIHLICEIHARENCERKLKSLNFKETHINLFLNEIYGQQHGNKRIGGLIDCETESDFDSSLINLGRKWDAIEVTETGRKPPEFFYLVQEIQSRRV
ncbi:uncharacterized protein LOC134233111 [Saccostrea cucullata]|uniref:uncharacterized protein LOC134233111 n=1 Tax=Saccostrea cuccullata TaxID=36930 RepID=UPI002ED0F3B0